MAALGTCMVDTAYFNTFLYNCSMGDLFIVVINFVVVLTKIKKKKGKRTDVL